MKLLFCSKCLDMIKLDYDLRQCQCGKVMGRHLSSRKAVYAGPAIAIDVDNVSLVKAMSSDVKGDVPLDTKVVDKDNPLFKKVKKKEIPKGDYLTLDFDS